MKKNLYYLNKEKSILIYISHMYLEEEHEKQLITIDVSADEYSEVAIPYFEEFFMMYRHNMVSLKIISLNFIEDTFYIIQAQIKNNKLYLFIGSGEGTDAKSFMLTYAKKGDRFKYSGYSEFKNNKYEFALLSDMIESQESNDQEIEYFSYYYPSMNTPEIMRYNTKTGEFSIDSYNIKTKKDLSEAWSMIRSINGSDYIFLQNNDNEYSIYIWKEESLVKMIDLELPKDNKFLIDFSVF